MPYGEARWRSRVNRGIIKRALADPELDVDGLVRDLTPLPALDPLADPQALSVS